MSATADPAASAVRSADGFVAALRPQLDVVAAVARRFASPQEADDVTQEALLIAWQCRDRFDPCRGSFRAWLLAIVVNESRRAARRNRSRERLAVALARRSPHAMPVGLTAAGDDDELAAVEAAIARLPRRQREVIGLYYFIDLPIDEIAAALGLASGTVKSTLADARERIRRALEGGGQHFGTLPRSRR